MNCKNCGAPLSGSICEYCGTEYEFVDLKLLPELSRAIQSTASQIDTLPKLRSSNKSLAGLFFGVYWLAVVILSHGTVVVGLVAILIICFCTYSLVSIGKYNENLKRQRAEMERTLSDYITRYNDIARKNGLPDW